MLAVIDGTNRIIRSLCPPLANLTVTSGTIYWVYMGRVVAPVTLKYICLQVRTVGGSAGPCEYAIAAGDGPPQKRNRIMTTLCATSSVDVMNVGTGAKRNMTAFALTPRIGTHVYTGVRMALTTTQANIMSLGLDNGQGWCLTTAGASAITTGTAYNAATIAASGSGVAPDMQLELD